MLGKSLQTPFRSRTLGVLSSLLSVVLMTGCMGGGGSDDSGDTESAATCGRPEVRNHLVEESQRDHLTLDLCFDAQEGSVDSGDHISDVVYENDRLVFTAEEVDRPRETEVVILDPEGKTQVRVNIAIQNTSGESIERQATHLANQQQAILNLREDRRIYDYMLEVAYLEERITASEKQALMDEWRPESEETHAELSRRLAETAEVLEAYQNGDVSESELAATADNAVAVMPNHGEYGARRLSELASEQNSPVPDTSHGTLTYRDDASIVSRRVGNRNYGEFQNDEWQFDTTFRFLTSVTNEETRS